MDVKIMPFLVGSSKSSKLNKTWIMTLLEGAEMEGRKKLKIRVIVKAATAAVSAARCTRFVSHE